MSDNYQLNRIPRFGANDMSRSVNNSDNSASAWKASNRTNSISKVNPS